MVLSTDISILLIFISSVSLHVSFRSLLNFRISFQNQYGPKTLRRGFESTCRLRKFALRIWIRIRAFDLWVINGANIYGSKLMKCTLKELRKVFGIYDIKIQQSVRSTLFLDLWFGFRPFSNTININVRGFCIKQYRLFSDLLDEIIRNHSRNMIIYDN